MHRNALQMRLKERYGEYTKSVMRYYTYRITIFKRTLNEEVRHHIYSSTEYPLSITVRRGYITSC